MSGRALPTGWKHGDARLRAAKLGGGRERGDLQGFSTSESIISKIAKICLGFRYWQASLERLRANFGFAKVFAKIRYWEISCPFAGKKGVKPFAKILVEKLFYSEISVSRMFQGHLILSSRPRVGISNTSES